MDKTMLDTVERKISSSQLRKLKKFGGRISKFGVNFAVCNGSGEMILLLEEGGFSSDREQLAKLSLCVLERSNDRTCRYGDDIVCRFGEPPQFLAVALRLAGKAVGVVLVDISKPHDGTCREGLFTEMLSLLAENFQSDSRAEQQIEMVSSELSHVYEELVLLHKLSTNMKVTEPDANFLQMACDNLTDIVSVEGIAILLERAVDGERQFVLAAGSGLIDIDEHMVAILHDRLSTEVNSGKEALLDSEVDGPFKYNWLGSIKNIIAVPLYGNGEHGSGLTAASLYSQGKTARNKGKQEHLAISGENPEGRTKSQSQSGMFMGRAAVKARSDNFMIGFMVAINRVDKPDFDSTDVKLFNSVANECAVFIENGRLFKDLKELFVGSLKALTSSIDAKDQYTHGHSERVAFISRWIAERLAAQEGLEEEQIHKIYLAGLLHDVGKVGIDESVLRKKGTLTEQEFKHIKKHPSIGAGILSEIKQMRDIVPGILCHHEQINGKGYPNGLSGDQIPLVGKIVGLADSFDAMTSKRTYRRALSVEEAVAEIEKDMGSHFDEKVGRVFLNSDVYLLWDILQDGFTEVYENKGLSEYGTVVVGTLIR